MPSRFVRKTRCGLHWIENLGLIVIAIATVIAVGQEILGIIRSGEAGLADLLLLFRLHPRVLNPSRSGSPRRTATPWADSFSGVSEPPSRALAALHSGGGGAAAGVTRAIEKTALRPLRSQEPLFSVLTRRRAAGRRLQPPFLAPPLSPAAKTRENSGFAPGRLTAPGATQ